MSISIIHHIDRLKGDNHVIIPVDAEKAFDKIEDPPRTLRKLRIGGQFP